MRDLWNLTIRLYESYKPRREPRRIAYAILIMISESNCFCFPCYTLPISFGQVVASGRLTHDDLWSMCGKDHQGNP